MISKSPATDDKNYGDDVSNISKKLGMVPRDWFFLEQTRFRMLPAFETHTQKEINARTKTTLSRKKMELAQVWDRLAAGDRSLTEVNCFCRTIKDIHNLATGLRGMTQVRVLRLRMNPILQLMQEPAKNGTVGGNNDKDKDIVTARLAMEQLVDCFLSGGLPNLEELEWCENQGYLLEYFASLFCSMKRQQEQPSHGEDQQEQSALPVIVKKKNTMPKLSKLMIHCWSVTEKACKEIAQFLKSLNSLESISLSLVHDKRLATVFEGVIELPLVRSLMVATSMQISDPAAKGLVQIISKNRLRDLTILKFCSGLVGGSPTAHGIVLGSIFSNTSSVERLTTNCLFQNIGGQHVSSSSSRTRTSQQLCSLRLLGPGASKVKLPDYSLPRLSSSVQELVFEDVVQVFQIPRITSVLQKLNNARGSSSSSSIRRLVVRKAVLDLGIEKTGSKRVAIHDFLRAMTEMKQLEHLTIGFVGNAFLEILSEHLAQFQSLKSLTLFTNCTFSSDIMGCLVDQMHQVSTLCDVQIWPSNDPEEKCPAQKEFQEEIEQVLHRNRLRVVAGKDKSFCLADKKEQVQRTRTALMVLEGRVNICPAVWPHLLSRLGRVKGYDEHGEPKVMSWHDIAHGLLRQTPEILHRPQFE